MMIENAVAFLLQLRVQGCSVCQLLIDYLHTFIYIVAGMLSIVLILFHGVDGPNLLMLVV